MRGCGAVGGRRVTTTWCVGIDFGKQSDRTAIAALEVVPREPDGDSRKRKPWLDVRFLQRLPVGLAYPDQCAQLAGLILNTAELARAQVAVDATGVGVAVSDILREHLPNGFTEISITGGAQTVIDGHRASIPKRDLVSRVNVVMQGRRLRVAKGLPDAAALYEELRNFEARISDAGHDSYSARSGHDDLIMATSYAVWLAEGDRNGASAWTDYYRRAAEKLTQPAAPPPSGRSDSDRIHAARTAAFRNEQYTSRNLY